MYSMNAPATTPPDIKIWDNPIAASVVICAIVMVAIAGAAVAMRFYTRTRIVKVLGKEDWLILAALVFSVGNSVGMIKQVQWGHGTDINLLTPMNLVMIIKASWFSVLFYNTSLYLTKISILVLYVRILTLATAQRLAWVALIFVTICSVWITVVIFTACVPLHKYWDGETTLPGYCQPMEVWWTVNGVNVGTDLLIFVLPLPLVFSLRLPFRQKVALCAVFALGLFVCLISGLRIVWVRELWYSQNFTRDHAVISKWTIIELNAAITCACLTTVKPLLSSLFPRLFIPSITSSGSGGIVKEKNIIDHGVVDYVSPRPSTIGGTRSSRYQRRREPDLEENWPLPATGTIGANKDLGVAVEKEEVSWTAIHAREIGRQDSPILPLSVHIPTGQERRYEMSTAWAAHPPPPISMR